MWDEAKKYCAASPGRKRHPDVGTVAKDLALADVNMGEFLTSKYSLWLDLRTSDDDSLHGSGCRIQKCQRRRYDPDHEEGRGDRRFEHLSVFVMDAQPNIEDGRFVSAVYYPLGVDGPFGDDMRTDAMWKNSFHLGSARRPPGVLSTHHDPVPDRTA